jgi:hypothetical protein
MFHVLVAPVGQVELFGLVQLIVFSVCTSFQVIIFENKITLKTRTTAISLRRIAVLCLFQSEFAFVIPRLKSKSVPEYDRHEESPEINSFLIINS